jgi:malonyl-ACP decarboxylase
MTRPGRQLPDSGEAAFIGAQIDDAALPAVLDARTARGASWAGRVAVATLGEAWDAAALAALPATRVGLVLGGSNLHQRELANLHDEYAVRRSYVRPTHAAGFLDTDILGLCCERYGIRGPSFACAAASASGQMALIQAAHAVRRGDVDACIALGAPTDVSAWELQAMRSAGALGGEAFATQPWRACRPFDGSRDGFVYGESCAALVVERAHSARARGIVPRAWLAGIGCANDASRGTAPSLQGEVDALLQALHNANAHAEEVDYYNAHGTGSIIGDETEVQAVHCAGVSGAYINATKSITGHGLSAAGAVELAATVLQMEGGWLHPTLNLEQPIDRALRWVTAPRTTRIDVALSLSLGFGGFNTAVCLRRWGSD